jgi:DNA repair photolyase
MYISIKAVKALNDNKSDWLPYKWDLNIYRGCEHRCVYCYALYSHKYLDDDKFYDHIYFKENIVECLEKQLSSPKWKKELISIGTVCDSYQPLEKEKKYMPRILKLLIKYKNPCIISTKSDLILRDLSLIDELSKVTYVGVSVSITTMDEEVAKKIEPNVISPQKRFEVLRILKQNTNASVGLNMMPIIPYLTDSKENIELLIKKARSLNLDRVICDGLNLYSETKKSFMKFIASQYPSLYTPIKTLYSNNRLLNEHRKKISEICYEARKKYNLLKKRDPKSLPIRTKVKNEAENKIKTEIKNKIKNEIKNEQKPKQLSMFDNKD